MKKQREFTQADINGVIVELAQRDLQAKKQQREPRQRSAGVS
jgi:hypothetical protein